MEFLKNVKSFSLICALTLFTAMAVSACGSSDTQQGLTAEEVVRAEDAVTADPVAPTDDNNEPVGPGGVRPGFDNVVTGGVVVGVEPAEPKTPPSPGGNVETPELDLCSNGDSTDAGRFNGTQVGTEADTVDRTGCIRG